VRQRPAIGTTAWRPLALRRIKRLTTGTLSIQNKQAHHVWAVENLRQRFLGFLRRGFACVNTELVEVSKPAIRQSLTLWIKRFATTEPFEAPRIFSLPLSRCASLHYEITAPTQDFTTETQRHGGRWMVKGAERQCSRKHSHAFSTLYRPHASVPPRLLFDGSTRSPQASSGLLPAS